MPHLRRNNSFKVWLVTFAITRVVSPMTVLVSQRSKLLPQLALAFAALVTADRHRLGVEQKGRLAQHAEPVKPVATHLFDQQTQSAGAAIELTLIHQLGEQVEVIGAALAETLGLAGKGQKVLCQPQGDQFRVAKDRLRSDLAFQEARGIRFVPVINEGGHDCQQSWKVYTVHGKCLPVLVWIEVGASSKEDSRGLSLLSIQFHISRII